MAKLTLTDISGGYMSASGFNANNALIEAALENTLSRDGTAPNSMDADLDMNSYDLNNVTQMVMTGAGLITNVKSISTEALVLNGEAVTTTESLTGGLAASEVTYDASDLATKLDSEFLKNNENGSLTGTLTVSGLVTASNALTVTSGNATISSGNVVVSAGDVNVTGNIAVSGTVDGVDVAALETDVQTLQTDTDRPIAYNIATSGSESQNPSGATVVTVNHTASAVDKLVKVTFSFEVTVENQGTSANDISLVFTCAGGTNPTGTGSVEYDAYFEDLSPNDQRSIPITVTFIKQANSTSAIDYTLHCSSTDTESPDAFLVYVGDPFDRSWTAIAEQIT